MIRQLITKFEKSNVYILYNDLLDDVNTIDTNKLDYYQTTLDGMVDAFNGGSIPNDDNIIEYCDNNEYIDEDNITDFIKFVKYIFENGYNIIKTLKTIHNKELKQDAKNNKKKELLNKKHEWSTTICVCDLCGIKYTQANRNRHLSTEQHITRMEAIIWYINKTGQPLGEEYKIL